MSTTSWSFIASLACFLGCSETPVNSSLEQAIETVMQPTPDLAVSQSEVAAKAPTQFEVGVNIDNNSDWMTSRIWVDVRKTFRAWGEVDRPWIARPNIKVTADGYPLEDAATIAMLTEYPDGVYTLCYEGSGDVEFAQSSIAQLATPIQRVGNRSIASVRVQHQGSALMHLIVRRVDPRNPIRNLRLLQPGYPPDTKEIFTPAFVRRLQPFQCIRFMDWLATNNNTTREWSERTRPTSFLCSGKTSVALEDVLALAEKADKDLWINIPDQASDDYVRQLADLLKKHVSPERVVHVEYSNELWNAQFQQHHRLVAAGAANSQLTRSDPFGRAGEQAAFRVKQIAHILRERLATGGPKVRIILAGQAVNPYFIEIGLKYLQAHYGPPHDYIDEIAIAPYLGNTKNVDPCENLDDLFATLQKHFSTTVTDGVHKHRLLAEKYNLALTAYEGGQHLTAGFPEMHEPLKRAAQSDPRMGTLLKQLLALWKAEGGGTFIHFSHVSQPSKYGYWGLLESIDQPGSVKWDAVMSVALPAGDANLDHQVTFEDFKILRDHFGQQAYWEQGDFNLDRKVDRQDLELLASNLLIDNQHSLSAWQQKEFETFQKKARQN